MPLWRILNHHGHKTHVIGVPITYPPEAIDGVMIAGMLSPLNADYAWPTGLADTLRSLGFVPDLENWRSRQEMNLTVLQAQHDLKVSVLRVLLEGSDWDLTMVVFKSLDVLKHRVYQGAADRIMTEHYARLDDALGQLIESAGPNTHVLLMSDHGFRTYHQRLSVNGVLVEMGLATLNPDAGNPVEGWGAPFAGDREVRLLPEIADLDMSRTQAFGHWFDGNYTALRLNVKGREPQGTIQPDQYETAMHEIRRKLLSFRAGPDGPPVFVRVERFADVYPGPHTDLMPDLLIEADPKYLCRMQFSRPTIEFLVLHPLPDHERTGILIAAGPSIRYDPQRGHASVMDIAPTVMRLFSLPPYAEMDGRVLAEIFKSPPPLARIDEPDLPAWVGTGSAVDTTSDDEVIERLRALGYVGRR